MSIPKRNTNLGPRTKPASPAAQAETPAAPSVADSFIEPVQSMLTVRIDANLHRRFKSTVAASGMKMRDVVEELLEDWTRRNNT